MKIYSMIVAVMLKYKTDVQNFELYGIRTRSSIWSEEFHRRRWNVAPLVILFEDAAPPKLIPYRYPRGGTIGFKGSERRAMMRPLDEAMGIRWEVAAHPKRAGGS